MLTKQKIFQDHIAQIFEIFYFVSLVKANESLLRTNWSLV